MTDVAQTTVDPRWGPCDRDKKAKAILGTLQLHCGRDLKNGLWLDIGCGSGGIAAKLACHVEKMVGVDPEPWERWAAYRQQQPNLAFHAGTYHDLENLLGRDSCDVVICNQVYEHVDKPEALLRAVHGVLKLGGICYFAGPNLLWPIEPHVFWPFVHWLPRAFAQRAMRALGSRHSAEFDAYSTHYWRLRRWFRDAGLVPHNAIAARIEAGFAVRGKRLPGWLAAMVDATAGISPGFVFVLSKATIAN